MLSSALRQACRVLGSDPDVERRPLPLAAALRPENARRLARSSHALQSIHEYVGAAGRALLAGRPCCGGRAAGSACTCPGTHCPLGDVEQPPTRALPTHPSAGDLHGIPGAAQASLAPHTPLAATTPRRRSSRCRPPWLHSRLRSAARAAPSARAPRASEDGLLCLGKVGGEHASGALREAPHAVDRPNTNTKNPQAGRTASGIWAGRSNVDTCAAGSTAPGIFVAWEAGVHGVATSSCGWRGASKYQGRPQADAKAAGFPRAPALTSGRLHVAAQALGSPHCSCPRVLQ